MKITVEFDSLAEIDKFCNNVYIIPLAAAVREEEKQQKAEEAKESKKEKKKVEEPKSEPEPVKGEVAAPEEPKADAPEVDVDKLKVELRKLLAAVNKKTGTNTASTWIKDIAGKSKLTEIDDAEALVALKAKAEEELNG